MEAYDYRNIDSRLERLIRGYQKDAVLIDENWYPPKYDMDVVRRPSINLTIHFRDARNLETGRYSLFQTEYGHEEANASYDEWIYARLIAGFKKLRPDVRRELAEQYMEMLREKDTKMNNSYFNDMKDCLAFGVHPIFGRGTPEETRALNFLTTYRSVLLNELFGLPLTVHELFESPLTGFAKEEDIYTNIMTTFFAEYNLYAEGIKRTVARLPELAGRRVMGMRRKVNAILPLNYNLSFLSEELASIQGDGLTVKVEEYSRPSTLRQQIMSMLKQSGVSPLTATSRDGIILVHEKLNPTYFAAPQHVARALFADILDASLPLMHTNYESDLLCSKVASQFDREEIAYLVVRIRRGLVLEGFIKETKEFARERGYAFPTTVEEAKKLGMM